MDQIGTTQAPTRGDGGGSEHRQCHHGPLKRIRCRTGWDLHRGRLPCDDDRDAHLGAANGGGTLKPSPASPPCGTHGKCCACSLAPASPPGCATTSTTTCPSCWAASARLPTAPKRAQRSTKSPCRRRTAGMVGHQEPASARCRVILIRSNITSSAAIHVGVIPQHQCLALAGGSSPGAVRFAAHSSKLMALSSPLGASGSGFGAYLSTIARCRSTDRDRFTTCARYGPSAAEVSPGAQGPHRRHREFHRRLERPMSPLRWTKTVEELLRHSRPGKRTRFTRH